MLQFLMDYLTTAKAPPTRDKEMARAFARVMVPTGSFIAHGGLALFIGTIVFVVILVGGLSVLSSFHADEATWARLVVVSLAGLTFLLPWLYLVRVIRWRRQRAELLFRHGLLSEVALLNPRRVSEHRGMNSYTATHATLEFTTEATNFVGTLRLQGDHCAAMEAAGHCAVLTHPVLNYLAAFPLTGAPVRVEIKAQP